MQLTFEKNDTMLTKRAVIKGVNWALVDLKLIDGRELHEVYLSDIRIDTLHVKAMDGSFEHDMGIEAIDTIRVK